MSFKTLFNDILTKKELHISNYVGHIHIILQTLNNMKRIHVIYVFNDIIHYYILGQKFTFSHVKYIYTRLILYKTNSYILWLKSCVYFLDI